MRKIGFTLLLGLCLALGSCGTQEEQKHLKEPTNFEPDPDYQTKQINVFGNVGDSSLAWKYYTGKGVTIAIIDGGFDYQHPEFYYSDGTSKVSDLSCFISTEDGVTSVQVGKDKTKITDGDSHGTMCAGLAAAANNGIGITGMAPDATLLLIKIDKKPKSFAKAFKYAVDNGAKVISTSLGDYQRDKGGSGDIVYEAGEDISHAFDESIKYAYEKGAVICSAAGNSYSTEPSYPAACPYALGVGGVKASDKHAIWKAEFEGSNYNGDFTYVDVCAPCIRIYGPTQDGDTHTYSQGWSGTSFASPLIAGAAALYFEQNPSATPLDFEKQLEKTCFDLSQTNKENLGYGQLDVVKLLGIE